jgi:hypothetical protein
METSTKRKSTLSILKKKLESLRSDLESVWRKNQEKSEKGLNIEPSMREQPLSTLLDMDDEEFHSWSRERRENPKSLPYKIVESINVDRKRAEWMEKQSSYLWKNAPNKVLQVKEKLEGVRFRIAYMWQNGSFMNGSRLSDALHMNGGDFKTWASNPYKMM